MLKYWTPKLQGKKVVLHSDSATAVAAFQADKGRNSFIHACTKEIWSACTVNNITVSVLHNPGEQLRLS